MCERQIQEPTQDKNILAGLCALTLEISRYRWMKRADESFSEIRREQRENECLSGYEGLVKRFLISNPDAAQKILQLYQEAWQVDRSVASYEVK